MKKNKFFHSLILILVLFSLSLLFYASFRYPVKNIENYEDSATIPLSELKEQREIARQDAIAARTEAKDALDIYRAADEELRAALQESTVSGSRPTGSAPRPTGSGSVASSSANFAQTSTTSASQGPGDYNFKFSINGTNIVANAILTIDSNNNAVKMIMADDANETNFLSDVNTYLYDVDVVKGNNNKIKVMGPNNYVFGTEGRGGVSIRWLGDDIGEKLLPNSQLTSYFFNTDKNGNQNLNAYSSRGGSAGYVKIPQNRYTLTITKSVSSVNNSSRSGSAPRSTDYNFKFSINRTNIVANVILTIDSNNNAVKMIMDGDTDNNNLLLYVNTHSYDMYVVKGNDNKIKVTGPNDYVFGTAGSGGVSISSLGTEIDNNLDPEFKNLNYYFFNTGKNGKQNLNAYTRGGNASKYVEIPQDRYTLTITKI